MDAIIDKINELPIQDKEILIKKIISDFDTNKIKEVVFYLQKVLIQNNTKKITIYDDVYI